MLRNGRRGCKRVKALGEALARTGAAAALETARAACAQAQSLAPVDTGRLRGSIRVRAEKDAAAVATDCSYAAAVELGTSACAARPFLKPAADGQRTAFVRAARMAWGGDGR